MALDKNTSLMDMLARLRKERKMSYEDIAEKGVIPAPLVEQIEKGMISPSIGALKKITKALEIPLADFFQQLGLTEEEVAELESSQDVVHVPKDRRKSLGVKGSQAVIEYLTPTKVERNLEVLWQEVEARASGGGLAIPCG